MVAHSTGEAAQVLRYGYDDGPGRQRWLPSSAQMPGAAASEADAQPGQGVPVRFSWGPLLRPESVTDSGGATTSFDFDFEGNLASLTPPATPEHGAAAAHPFDVTGWNKLKQDTPPGVSGVPEPQTEWAYDNDGALPSVRLPDGRTVTVDYDADHGYRVSKMHFGVGDLTLGYVERTPTPGGPGQAPTCASDGELVSATMPQYGGEPAVTTAIERDGPLVTKLTWSGGVSGEVSFGYEPPDGAPRRRGALQARFGRARSRVATQRTRRALGRATRRLVEVGGGTCATQDWWRWCSARVRWWDAATGRGRRLRRAVSRRSR
ncbi:MAG: hypothetical protein KC543_12125 [Myxococcales bacterium]|nr:hypothetical protein [Myxococcales bacterium]